MVTSGAPEVNIGFELSAPGIGLAAYIRLRGANGRWLAVSTVRGRIQTAIGGTAREALTASLATVDRQGRTALLADPRLFGVSAAILGAA